MQEIIDRVHWLVVSPYLFFTKWLIEKDCVTKSLIVKSRDSETCCCYIRKVKLTNWSLCSKTTLFKFEIIYFYTLTKLIT